MVNLLDCPGLNRIETHVIFSRLPFSIESHGIVGNDAVEEDDWRGAKWVRVGVRSGLR